VYATGKTSNWTLCHNGNSVLLSSCRPSGSCSRCLRSGKLFYCLCPPAGTHPNGIGEPIGDPAAFIPNIQNYTFEKCNFYSGTGYCDRSPTDRCRYDMFLQKAKQSGWSAALGRLMNNLFAFKMSPFFLSEDICLLKFI